MKKATLIFVFVLAFTLAIPQVAYANMAAPILSDIGSSITFEKHDSISVLSEVLDITVEGSKANIVSTYKMKNATDQNITTQAMFVSPNIENSGVRVVVNDKEVSFTVKSYDLNYNTEVKVVDWQYVILTDDELEDSNDGYTVDTITFEMDFAPNEEYEVIVSYLYRLGGYPDYDYSAKRGNIEYYLTPANMWKDFGGITINLKLDEDMPVIKSSNLRFEKVDTRTYQYISDTLPDKNLSITIDQNWWQNFLGLFKSPYLLMTIMVFMPFIIVALIVVIFIIWYLRKKKKNKMKS